MRDRLSIFTRGPLIVLLVLGWVAAPAMGQPPRATCDGMENLTGTDMTPQSLILTAPLSDDLTMTGAGCTAAGGASVDHVTCFVPENDCTLDFDCFYPGAPITISINIYSGACATTPASCITSASGTNSAAVMGVALTAGTQYCVVCESAVNATSLSLAFDADGGSTCGALPVNLQEFSISHLDEVEDSEPESEAASAR